MKEFKVRAGLILIIDLGHKWNKNKPGNTDVFYQIFHSETATPAKFEKLFGKSEVISHIPESIAFKFEDFIASLAQIFGLEYKSINIQTEEIYMSNILSFEFY